MNPNVLLCDSTPLLQELQRLTRTIPLVFASVADPVATGIVSSLAHPGGNATGFMNPEPTMSGRWLELLKEIAPNLTRVLVLVNAGNVGNQAPLRVIEEAAPSFGVKVSVATTRVAPDIENAIRAASGEPHLGLIVVPGYATISLRKLVVELAAQHRLPAIYPYRDFVAEGGLMSYGAENAPMWAQAANYVDRILRGAIPADLPVQAPTGFQLVVNIKAAAAIGLPISEAFLLRADELIE